MAIELSSLTFTDKADIIPASGVDEIVNTGIANTLAGNDVIISTKELIRDGIRQDRSSFFNSGTLNTGDDNDIITGTISGTNYLSVPTGHPGNFYIPFYYGIKNIGYIYTSDGDDRITGINEVSFFRDGNHLDFGIFTVGGTIDTGDGNDIITGICLRDVGIESRNSTINTGNGDDTITGTGRFYGISNDFDSSLNTGEGNDTITGNAVGQIYSDGIYNIGVINTGGGDDIIIGRGTNMYGSPGRGLSNFHEGFIDTGDGNDTIIGIFYESQGISNTGTINTGNGNDIITGTGKEYGIFSSGTINTGNGEDSIIADGGFGGTGSVFLGNGKDYLKGFGSGNFNGGNGKDTLELTSGIYTVRILGTTVNFTKASIIMNTSEFEKLVAGSTTYNFSSLTDSQTIYVA
jgi:hypothetical protein